MTTSSEPRNPLYLLLLLVGFLFVITAVAYAILPVLEQQAIDAGQPPPPSAFRDALRQQGGRWLLSELALLVLLGIGSMVWDHRSARQIPSADLTRSAETSLPSLQTTVPQDRIPSDSTPTSPSDTPLG